MAATQATPETFTGSRAKGSKQVGEQVAHLTTMFFAACILLVTLLILWTLWGQSAEARAKFGFGLSFFSSHDWDPNNGQFGALPFIYGTALTALLSMIIAVPIAVGTAIFLSELAPPRFSSPLTFLVELLAAVPSVIYGLLAIFT